MRANELNNASEIREAILDKYIERDTYGLNTEERIYIQIDRESNKGKLIISDGDGMLFPDKDLYLLVTLSAIMPGEDPIDRYYQEKDTIIDDILYFSGMSREGLLDDIIKERQIEDIESLNEIEYDDLLIYAMSHYESDMRQTIEDDNRDNADEYYTETIDEIMDTDLDEDGN